jgi:hypothetical protein
MRAGEVAVAAGFTGSKVQDYGYARFPQTGGVARCFIGNVEVGTELQRPPHGRFAGQAQAQWPLIARNNPAVPLGFQPVRRLYGARVAA